MARWSFSTKKKKSLASTPKQRTHLAYIERTLSGKGSAMDLFLLLLLIPLNHHPDIFTLPRQDFSSLTSRALVLLRIFVIRSGGFQRMTAIVICRRTRFLSGGFGGAPAIHRDAFSAIGSDVLGCHHGGV